MTGAILLWSHALAALLFATLGLATLRSARDGVARATGIALVLSALAALTVAGIGAGGVEAALAEGVRDAAWLVPLLLIARASGGVPAGVAAVYGSTAVAIAAAVLLAFAEQRVAPGGWLGLRMLAAAGALAIVSRYRRSGQARGNILIPAAALAVIWGGDLIAFTVAWGQGMLADGLVAARGVTLAVAAGLFVGTLAGDRDSVALSRPLVLKLVAAVALAGYAGAVVLATGAAAGIRAIDPRVAQTAIVFGANAALLAFLSTPWLRAWARVKLAKHFFRHRYDYRTEWQRFTATLAEADAGAERLGERIVRAVAAFTDSPAGSLLIVDDGGGLAVDAGWGWRAEPLGGGGEALAAHCAGGRIVALDRVRAAGDGAERDAIPAALLAHADAWAIVPLIHGRTLVAAVVLARPPVAHVLDWEDFDLLRVAGRQAASYLAEDRAHEALVEARRFDEFNRRFAFIMHDLKNLVSQMTLTARNARRHADNPAFRADMVATLGDCADRMTALIARLSTHGDQPAEPLAPVDVAAIGRALARRFPLAVEGSAPPVRAHPLRLEQVLAHLVQNAVEAGPSGGAVVLRLAATPTQVAIEVIDRGCGMSPAFIRDSLFRPFASAKPGGFGLGAHEARQLVLGMGGTLSVDSREGEGTRFRILLDQLLPLEVAA